MTRRIGSIPHAGEHPKIAADMPHARHLVAGGLATGQEAALAHLNGYRDYERADYPVARKLQEQVLAVRRGSLGEDHADTLAAMTNLAATMYAQGDLAGARALHERVVAACRRVLGTQHPHTLTATGNLARTTSAQGDPAGAERLQELVLAASRHPA